MMPIIYDAVNVSIENSSVILPLSFYDFKRSDVVSFLLTPTLATNTVIHLSGSMQVTQTNTLPVAAISMLRSAVETSIVRVNGLIDAGPMIVAFLGHSSVSASTFFTFANNSFRDAGLATTRSASVFGSGVTTSLSIHTVKDTGGSVFDISDNTFSGDEHHTLFSNALTWLSSPSPTTPLLQSNNFPVIHLGCNRLNGNPLAASNIGIPRGLLHTLVDYPPAPFHGGGDGEAAWCVGLPPDTQTMTPSLPFEEDTVPVLTSAVAAAWVAAAASLGSLLSLSPAALVEGQTLAVMGSSACAPPALRTSTSITQYTLSPFYALGPAAMVLGNGGLALFIVACHAFSAMLLLPWLALRREHQAAAAAAAEGSYSDQHRHRHVDPSVLTCASATKRLPSFFSVAYRSSKEWRIRLQFPNHSLTACVVMLQGIVYGTTSELFAADVRAAGWVRGRCCLAAGESPAERCAVRGGLRAASGAVCDDGAAGERTRRRCR